MLAEPGEWQGYYEGDEQEQRIARRYSYSDRMRYYWPDETIEAARATLMRNLTATAIPLPLISQYLPDQYRRIRDGDLEAHPEELVVDRVRDALRPYARACATPSTDGASRV
jgi:D-tagatose-1,6-bisphosphate aldolase subunit GatZ/KbaZ